ncbi:hypothetical protein L249_8966 [Ophiocordyceps polyrhachis-furcata BCC 54312]|uniref:Uncharacterized protein n=1 Tax=Ophiocordyceps polyrhachis-furcata BCC 54312 TaxID=1330021 RepID=A0A367L1Z2_9HYPO|nr:hypothetical protein L249_8966 [Ophiocordyceps polyrhachis-furcata BCC 54312]
MDGRVGDYARVFTMRSYRGPLSLSSRIFTARYPIWDSTEDKTAANGAITHAFTFTVRSSGTPSRFRLKHSAYSGVGSIGLTLVTYRYVRVLQVGTLKYLEKLSRDSSSSSLLRDYLSDLSTLYPLLV